MFQFKCSGCGELLKVRDELAGRRGKCPKCGAVIRLPGQSSVAADELAALAAAAEPAPAKGAPPEDAQPPPQGAPETPGKEFEVAFCVVRRLGLAGRKHLYGTMVVRADQISLEGTSDRLEAGQTGAGIGAMISTPAARRRVRRQKHLIRPARSAARYDLKRRRVSLQLPGGRWLDIYPARRKRRNFPRLVDALREVFGKNIGLARLGRWSAGRKLAFWLIAVPLVLAILGAVVALAVLQ